MAPYVPLPPNRPQGKPLLSWPQWHWTPFLSTFLEHAGGRSPGLGLSNGPEIKKNRCFWSCSAGHDVCGQHALVFTDYPVCLSVFSFTPLPSQMGHTGTASDLSSCWLGLPKDSGPGTPMLKSHPPHLGCLGSQADAVASSGGPLVKPWA